VTQGRLANYHTSRETAAGLRAVTGQQPSQQPFRSHGCAVAWAPDNPVMVRTPHLTVSAGTKATSLENLYKDMARGLVVMGAGEIATDQQFVSGSFTDRGATTFEVERGKIVRRVQDSGLQFRTDMLLKGLLALGDTRTMRGTKIGDVFKGMPWQWAEHSVHAPAALFKEVNVISVGMFDPFKV
jgi:TldD protein